MLRTDRRIRRISFLAATLTLAAQIATAQSQGPSKSFVFNMTPVAGTLPQKLTAKVETGGNALSCGDVLALLRGVGINPSASANTGYVIQVFQTQNTELSQKQNDWYSFDSSWVNKEGSACTFNLYSHLEDLKSPTHFRDYRLWGRTSLEMVEILEIPATGSYLSVLQANKSRIQAALRNASKDAVDILCSQVGADATLGPANAACNARNQSAAQPFAALSDPAVDGVVSYLAKNITNAPPFFITQMYKEETVKWVPTPSCADDSTLATCRLAPNFDLSKATFKIQWDVTKTTPDPIQNLQTALSQGASGLQGVAAISIPLTLDLGLSPLPIFYVGARPQTINLLPSQLKVTGTLKPGGDPKNDVSLGSQTYQNEGRYFWNVSVAVPLKAVKTLDYDAATLQPKTLDNKAAFAVFDLYLGKVDTTNTKVRLIPAIFGGPSFTGKFLDRWMVGVSIGTWFVEPFWGYSFLGSNRPLDPADAAKGTYRRWEHAPVWGINIPIRNFYKLASNNAGKGTSTTKGGGSTTTSSGGTTTP